MIPGTGPGRGFPWWRRPAVLFLVLKQRIGTVGAEPAGERREGRTVAVIRRAR